MQPPVDLVAPEPRLAVQFRQRIEAQSRPEAGLDKPDRRLDLALGLGPRFHPKMLDFATASFRASVIPIEQRLGILALGELHPCWSSPRHSGELNRDCRRKT